MIGATPFVHNLNGEHQADGLETVAIRKRQEAAGGGRDENVEPDFVSEQDGRDHN